MGIKYLFSKVKRSISQISAITSKIPDSSGRYNSIKPIIIKEYNKERPSGFNNLFCYVPFTNLSFSFDGTIHSCNYNFSAVLGNYPQHSVKESWESIHALKLREHMLHNDLSFGCSYCKNFLMAGKFTGLKPQVYDKYASGKAGRYPTVMEFELSSNCNLECIMCNGMVSSAIRKNRDHKTSVESPYDDDFVNQLVEFIPHLKEAKFYGGEPFLIPIYYQIWEQIIRLNPSVNIFVITNGTILNDKIKSILQKGKFDLAVSIDSLKKSTFETIRKNAEFETVMKNLAFFNNYCKSRKKPLTVSKTIMIHNWEEIPNIVEFCNKIGAQVFFSYLLRPNNLSLRNLEINQLKEIYENLSGRQFSPINALSKYNVKCFYDILNQLNYWIEEKGSEVTNIGKFDSKELFHFKLEKYFAQNIENTNAEKDRREISERLKTAIDSASQIYPEADIYELVNDIPVDDIISNQRSNSDEQIIILLSDYIKTSCKYA